jgi:hypothetical protein
VTLLTPPCAGSDQVLQATWLYRGRRPSNSPCKGPGGNMPSGFGEFRRSGWLELSEKERAGADMPEAVRALGPLKGPGI